MKDFLFTDLISFVGEAPKKFDGYKKYVSTGAVNGNIIESDDIELVNYSSRPSRANLVACSGDILFAKMAETEKTLLLDDETEKNIYSTGFCAIRAKENIIEPKALYYLLGSSLFLNQKNTNSSGATQRAITNTGLSKIRIKLPTMEKQREFYGIMDKVVNSIELRKKQLGYFDELTKSLFIEMFGDPSTNPKKWVKTPLHKLCHISSSRRIYQNEQTLQGIPFLRISDLSNLINNGNTKVELYISEERYEELKSKNQVPKSGDILITSRGTLGECYIIKEDDKFYFQDGMISWMFDFVNYILPTYLKYLFDMREFKREITSRQIGTTVSYLSIEMIKKLQIMLPNIKLQYKFSELINKIDKSKLAVKKSLEELEILKKSLMQKYFA